MNNITQNIQFTKFTHPSEVGKIFELDPSGKFTSMTVGNLISASVETITIDKLSEFIPFLYSMTNKNHITAGINPTAHACIKGPMSEGVINRSNECLPFPTNSAALMCIDSDNVDKFPTIEAFHGHAAVRYTSSSSMITCQDDTEYRGFKGCHTFYAVQQGSDIPRVLKVLHQREILNYRGLCRVSKAGGFLERSIIDQALSSSSQPIYFQPTLLNGLKQERTIEPVSGIEKPIDTKKLVLDLTPDEEQQYKIAVQYYEQLLAEEMQQVRDQWINAKVNGGQGTVESLTKSLDHHALESDFIIHTKLGDFTVHEIMSDVKRFHRVSCRDPLEPEYGSTTVAMIFSDQDQPIINSNAHGGIKYKLYDAVSVFGGAAAPSEPMQQPGPVQQQPGPVQQQPGPVQQQISFGSYPITVPIQDDQWYDLQKRGSKAITTYENFEILAHRYGINIAYDIIAKDIIMAGPGMHNEGDLKGSANRALLTSSFELNNLKVSHIDEYVSRMMNANQYNPVQEYIKQVPWDGQQRLLELFNTLTLADDQDYYIAWMTFRKWMIGACRLVQGQINHFEFCLVLQESTGGIGKTRWFNKLCPAQFQADGIILDTQDKDTVKQCISHWLVELGELDSSFRKSDVKKLMAFLSKSEDEIRLPYAKVSAKFQRRTAFFGSVNGKNFLSDDSGDRRFWVIGVTAINYEHDINIQQIWAEVNAIDASEPHYLNAAENLQVIEANKEFKALDPIDEKLAILFNKQLPGKQKLTCTEILNRAGIEHPNKAQLNKAGKFLRDAGYLVKKNNGRKIYDVPLFPIISK